MKLIFSIFYTLIGYLFLFPVTALFVFIGLILNSLKLNNLVSKNVGIWARATFFIMGKSLNIIGKENMNPEEKYILMANHSSLFDIMAIMWIYPNVSWFGRAYLIEVPLFGKLLKSIKYVPMQTTNLRNTKLMLEQLISVTENRTIAIFPEGTRTETGEMNRFHKGFLHVLKATELTILPVTLCGFFDFKPKNRFYFNYSSKLTAVIHPPIKFEDIKDFEDNEIIEILQKKIKSPIKQQLKY
ncbi:MAG: hypothetical protein AUJ98_01785 [Bacteroidetes bacterium CG2_30_33_31]|nr:MAG: hypothetical protein AUJ98_01785 [Bacteroidetes bacterium CG2_30_33_31]